ncbi:hypothetical protein D8B20_18100 (plasmid) [Candidatus Pantoea soli]|uniref:Uncharacterized protein n=1 Tax=Candidatus Pantoea soli TaxID=3098669 RepID=A0A518XI26_9GAMM|nr:hypothetical protein D8B20_18100 [Pantoea soli]
MLKSHYFYLCPDADGSWVLHKKGCSVLTGKREKRFIGSLYTTHQALAVARVHQTRVICCSDCLTSSERPAPRQAETQRKKAPVPLRHYGNERKE